MSPAVLIGTYSWTHSDWADDYYPENLPSEWRFCYYGNQFRSVLVPTDIWPTVTLSDVDAWAEDSDPEFGFVLEAPFQSTTQLKQLEATVNQFADTIKPIQSQIRGVLLSLHDDHFESGVFPRLEQAFDILGQLAPVCLNAGPKAITDKLVKLAGGHKTSFCWHADREQAPQETGDFLVALSAETEANAQRRIVEMLDGWGAAGLFFTGPHAAESAQQARIIAELAGV